MVSNFRPEGSQNWGDNVFRHGSVGPEVATLHSFRHQCITWLTRHSGMADAELQLITGLARREINSECPSKNR
jgi:hypothetical protein